MMQTVFAEKLAHAGVDVDAARLLMIATRQLERTHLNAERAISQFQEIVESERGLRRALALKYLRDVAADMGGKNTGWRASLSDPSIGGGQRGRGTQTGLAPTDQTSLPRGQSDCDTQVGGATGHPVEDEAGHSLVAEQAKGHALVSSSPKSSDEGQRVYANAAITAMPSSPEPFCSGCHLERVNHLVPAPAAKPNPPRSNLAALGLVNKALSRTVMDTFRVRDGRPIGDIPWRELRELARSNEYEARILRHIEGFVANPRPGALVRDTVRVELVEAAIKHAAEAENV